jgi:hypothetical protein
MAEPSKVLIILTFEATPEQLPGIITAMDPPNLPHFAGELRITADPHASQLIAWLDEGETHG